MLRMMRATIFDYGAGNLHSLSKALMRAGARVSIESDPLVALESDVLVLPGVGNFASAAARLAPAKAAMRDAIAGGHPTLGVCLGMQLLFESSEESPGRGLGVISGSVQRLAAARVPQIGWNTIEHSVDSPLAQCGLDIAYYANSFVCRPADESSVVAWSAHEADRFPAVLRSGRTIGVQFHPEKSSAAGLRFIAAALLEIGR
jgi:imidazole glycerol-phosphate synthase subunit HisH